MYYRIVRERSWSEIEVKFTSLFDLRTKDAITSVYYRTRKMWGMDKVLETDLHVTIQTELRIIPKLSSYHWLILSSGVTASAGIT